MINYQLLTNGLGPDYMEAGWLGRRAGPFAEMELRLVLYVKELSRQAGQPSCICLRIECE